MMTMTVGLPVEKRFFYFQVMKLLFGRATLLRWYLLADVGVHTAYSLTLRRSRVR